MRQEDKRQKRLESEGEKTESEIKTKTDETNLSVIRKPNIHECDIFDILLDKVSPILAILEKNNDSTYFL